MDAICSVDTRNWQSMGLLRDFWSYLTSLYTVFIKLEALISLHFFNLFIYEVHPLFMEVVRWPPDGMKIQRLFAEKNFLQTSGILNRWLNYGKISSARYLRLQIPREVSKQSFSQPSSFKRKKTTLHQLEILTSCIVQSIDYGCAVMFDKLCVI